ncbi:hypothetical protein PCCS19_39300 [Paenibacillus sp. CCS19]|nr:hypothetical protein PCCS19_39300 [Paenibacillus cellulosilyticus]
MALYIADDAVDAVCVFFALCGLGMGRLHVSLREETLLSIIAKNVKRKAKNGKKSHAALGTIVSEGYRSRK